MYKHIKSNETVADKGGKMNAGVINGLKEGQIEFKAKPDRDNKISFYATANKITINWGNGHVEEFTLNGVKEKFTHEYPTGENFQTVSIVTESITIFSFNGANDATETLQELKFGECPELREVYCNNNQLTQLNLSDCTSLIRLDCHNNQLTQLSLSGCTSLEGLNCGNNKLKKLDLSGCEALTGLSCYNNKLIQLDLSDCTALTGLSCYNNGLIQLDLSKNTELEWLNCSSNDLSSSALNGLFESLPENVGSIYFSKNPDSLDCDRSIYESKGWQTQM